LECSDTKVVYISYLHLSYYVPYPSKFLNFVHSKNVSYRIKTVKLLRV
jgi:hypothetical protein